jgi:hypothetical protein
MTRHGSIGTIARTVALILAAAGCSPPTTPQVEAPPTPAESGFGLSLGDTKAHTVVPGEVLAIQLFIAREDGFEEPITLSASASPGIVVIFRPATVIRREESDLLVVAEQSSPRRTHLIQFTGHSPGRPAQSVTLSLTVVDTK